MRRGGKRLRVAPNIYRDDDKFEIDISGRGQRVSKSFSLDTPISILVRWRDAKKRALARRPPGASKGTLAHDVRRFINEIGYQPSSVQTASHLGAWVKLFGKRSRYSLGEGDVRTAFTIWTNAGVAPKTIRNRRQALQQLFHTLDDKDMPTPVDKEPGPDVPKPMPVAIDAAIIREVAWNLYAQERAGRLRDARTRARYLVLAACGRRPAELRRAQAVDVDLTRRVWRVRDAKGGWSAGLYLNDDMFEAWRLFVQADAWGDYDTRSMARRLRWCGWPDDVRPYNLRHSVGIGLSDLGVDLADIQHWMGHRHIETTRTFYVPVLGGRIQRAAEAIDGRLGAMPEPVERPERVAVRKTGTGR
jgi:integrase